MPEAVSTCGAKTMSGLSERMRAATSSIGAGANGAFYSAMRERLDGATAPVARGLLAHNNLLGFPYRHGFTAGALERMLDAVGCEVVKVYGDVLVPTADEWTRGWAALEERVVKGAMRAIARGDAERAPWMEVYARRVG